MKKQRDDRTAPLLDVLSIIIPYFNEYKRRLLVGFVALICVDLIQLIIPIFIKKGIDSLDAGSASQNSLLKVGVVIVGAAACVLVLRFIWRYLIIGFSRILEQHVRNRLFKHILKMDQPFFGRWTSGDLIAHASNDLNALQMASGMGLVAAVDAFVMTIAAVLFMSFISVKLTLLALLPMPFLAICTRILTSNLHQRFNLVQKQFGIITEFARTAISSIQLIQGYTLEEFQKGQFSQLGKSYVKNNMRVAMVQGGLLPLSTFIGNLSMLLVLYNGGVMVMKEQITIGAFVAFVTYMYMLIWPMMAIGWVSNIVQRGITSLRRIHRLFMEKPVVKDQDKDLLDSEGVTRLDIQSLSFTYPDTKQPVFSNLSFNIVPGITGITGKNGTGKSTLCKLLLRMYPVEDECLFVNGTDVNTLSLGSVRSLIAYVPQEPILFSDTIAFNISYGNPEAEQCEIEKAAKDAVIHNDIMEFPGGYQAKIGERGVKLSGGQRQRISLARALLCNRPVCIIDDGLNAVDVETEQNIIKALLTTSRFKTVLLVSHRINVLQVTDRIIVFEEDGIAAMGNHEQLLNHPFYRNMSEKQQSDA